MHSQITFQSWLDHLRCLLPVTGLLHIGMSSDVEEPPIYADWGVSDVLYLEADETFKGKLVGKTDVLFSGADFFPELLNWAIIDCLPSSLVLREEENFFENFEVIIVRVDPDDVTQSEVDSLFASSSFLKIAMQRDIDPLSIGQDLYVRHWQSSFNQRMEGIKRDALLRTEGQTALIANLHESLKKQAMCAAESRRQTEELICCRDEQTKLINDLQIRLGQANKATEEQFKLVDDLKRQLERVIKSKDELALLADKYQIQLDALSQMRDEQAVLATDIQEQIRNFAEIQTEHIIEQNKGLITKIEKMQADMIRLGKVMNGTVKKEILNGTKQIEAFLAVQEYLSTGELTGNMHGWPISPDFALCLIEQLETYDYDLIIEFGSGVSTVIIAKTISRIALRKGKRPLQYVAFEHMIEFYGQTLTRLQQANLEHLVQLFHAPLVPDTKPNGNTYLFYDCHKILAELAQDISHIIPRIFIIVDGPPATTGKHARYPALEATFRHFPNASYDIFLDDCHRDDEKEVVQLWLDDIHALGLVPTLLEKDLEKGACHVSFDNHSRHDIEGEHSSES